MEVLENGMPQPVDFTPCSICGRTFNPEVLARHERVCNQQTGKKRPVFDTSKKRIQGTDLQAFFASRPHLKTNKPSSADLKAAEKKKNWRRKHEDFIQSIRSVREFTEADATGGSIPPPRPSQLNPDYVQCPHCERRFEQYSAERHIPFCKETHSRIDRKGQDNKAMQKLNKRTQYKPPTLKKKSSTEQTPSNKSPSHGKPPRFHLIARNTNFHGTYTLDDENSPKKPSYQSPYRAGGNRAGQRGPIVKATVPKSLSHGKISSHTSATQARELPGSREPERMAGTRERSGMRHESSFGSSDEKLTRRRSLLKTPQSIVSGYNQQVRNGFDWRRGGVDGRLGLARQIRGAVENDGREFSSSSSLGDGEAPRLAPVKPRGKSRRVLRVHENSPPSHDDMTHSGSGGEFGPPRVGSGSSLSGRKGVPLNEHGMAMGKFCYQCGAKYPVPQAKYCCECGTKRI